MREWKLLAVRKSPKYRLVALAAFCPIRIDEHVEAGIGNYARVGEFRRLGSNEILVNPLTPLPILVCLEPGRIHPPPLGNWFQHVLRAGLQNH